MSRLSPLILKAAATERKKGASMNREYHFRAKGDAEQIRRVLGMLEGEIQTITTDAEGASVTWKPNTDVDPLQKVADIVQEGNYADGISLLELFRSNDPENTTILFNLGMAYSEYGDWDRAIEVLRKLIEKEPQHTNGLVALGVALLRANRTDEGIYELQTAISQEPGNVWAQHQLGNGLVQAGRNAEGLEHLRRALELRADNPSAWFDYGQALQANGDTREAHKAYRKVIDFDKSSEIAERARTAIKER
jgi:tetratricopeptide (TPR) repeat protein